MKHSYSSISQYQKCPKAWAAIHRDRIVERGPSPALQRGIQLHEELEKALVEDREPANLPEGCDQLPEGLLPYLQRLRRRPPDPENPVRVTPEMALAIDDQGRGCSWNSPHALLRGKIDVAVERFGSGQRSAMLLDYKSGKIRPDPLQAYCYAALAWGAVGHDRIDFRWVYVEHGEVRKEAADGASSWQHVRSIIQQMEQEGSDPVPKPSPLCRYCPVSWCPHNTNPEAK